MIALTDSRETSIKGDVVSGPLEPAAEQAAHCSSAAKDRDPHKPRRLPECATKDFSFRRLGMAAWALDPRLLSVIVSRSPPVVKYDGMIGPMLETVTIERKKLFQQVAVHLEGLILEGRLKPGDQLPPERDLQSRFGVGRPAIREALIALQRSGLIEISNGTRAKVAMPTAQGVVSGMGSAIRQMLSTQEGQRHFQGVRFFFETALARQAAREGTAEDIARLKEKLVANRGAIGDRSKFIETDVAFHFVLAEITRQPGLRRAARRAIGVAQGTTRRDPGRAEAGKNRL